MRKISFIILNLFIGYGFYAQDVKMNSADSLKNLLKITTSKKDIIDLNSKIAKEYYKNFDFKNAITFAKKNIVLATSLKLKPELAETNKFLTLVYINDSKHDSATYFNTKGYQLFKELDDKKGIAKTLLYFAIIAQNKSDFVKQTKYTLQSIKIATQIKDTATLEVGNRSLAMINLDQENFPNALKYSFESLKFAKQLNKDDKIGLSMASIAETYSLMKDYKNAEKYYTNAYSIFKRLDDQVGLAWVLTNWSNIQDDSKAFNMRLEAQKYLDITGPDNIMSINNLGNIGLLYSKMGANEREKRENLNLAESYLEKSLKISDKTENLDNTIEFLQVLSQVQAKKGKYENAYKTLEKYTSLHDSLYSQENKNKIAKLESQKDIEIRDKQIQINKIALKAKEKQKWFLISGIILLGIIGGLLLYQNKNREKTNQKLQLLNSNLDQANKTKTQVLNILNHDLRSPVNSFIHYIQFQKENPEVLDAKSKSRIENETLASAKNLLYSMEDILLWTKNQMENFTLQFSNVAVSTIFEDTKNYFSAQKNVSLFFENPNNIVLTTDENYLKTIIRNLTANAINAFNFDYQENKKPVIIWKAWQENNFTYLSISDNGVGADLEKIKALYNDTELLSGNSGLGLHLVRDLAKGIHCEITVDSKKDIGTTFTLKL